MRLHKILYISAIALGANLSATAGPLEDARAAFNRYDFEAATDILDGAKLTTNEERAEAQKLREKITLGETMLERVEQIQVIDSILVDRADFFRAYRLSPSTGFLVDLEALEDAVPSDFPVVPLSPAFVFENGEGVLWTADSDEPSEANVLWESDLLSDGTWDKPRQLLTYQSLFGEDSGRQIATPFLMSDGVTLYFAAEGAPSLGGLDIFISRRDGDSFFTPQNIGMPYNSPYDDYMLAIDEVTGVGWWATDRNQIPDKVTIYRFIPSELRQNYMPDTEGLEQLALLTDLSKTHPEGADYSEVLARIDAIVDPNDATTTDFVLAFPGGKVYTTLDEFTNADARRLMEEYVDAEDQYALDLQHLADLRAQYRGGDKGVATEIRRLEKTLPEARARLKSMKNRIILLETKHQSIS